MKGLVKKHWLRGLKYLFTEELLSFYVYFTIIFAECAFLWSHFPASTAITFTFILSAYIVNVIICSFFKGNWSGTLVEVIFTAIYSVASLAIFIVGCCINFLMCIVLTAIPLCITALCIVIREEQLRYDSKPLLNKYIYQFSQLLAIGGPYIAFVAFFATIPAVPIVLKVLIPLLYLVIIPFIPIIEDELLGGNIFEIAIDIEWQLLADAFSPQSSNPQKTSLNISGEIEVETKIKNNKN